VTPELRLRAEPPASAASRGLLDAYAALMHARLAAVGVEPGERFYASQDVFEGPRAAWLVAYEDGRPVGCGGLCSPAPGVGEVKRLFVAADARGRGYGRTLLRELERLALAHGLHTMRMVTAELLDEARGLYETDGYVLVKRVALPGGPVELEFEKPLHS
jgi:GNAT superfamily N-acetyltransferase